MRFHDIIVGWLGSLSDALVLQNSNIFAISKERKRLNEMELLLSKGTKLREYILSDAKFPLLLWIVTLYRRKGLLYFQIEFNKRISIAWAMAQRALTRLKEMWKIIQKVMWKPDKYKLTKDYSCLLYYAQYSYWYGRWNAKKMSLSCQHD